MPNTTEAVKLEQVSESIRYIPVKGGVRILPGTMVLVTAAGLAINGGPAVDNSNANAALSTVGLAIEEADNTTGADGAIKVPVRSGTYEVEVTGAAVVPDQVVYAASDYQVSADHDTNKRPKAGVVWQVNGARAQVRFGQKTS